MRLMPTFYRIGESSRAGGRGVGRTSANLSFGLGDGGGRVVADGAWALGDGDGMVATISVSGSGTGLMRRGRTGSVDDIGWRDGAVREDETAWEAGHGFQAISEVLVCGRGICIGEMWLVQLEILSK